MKIKITSGDTRKIALILKDGRLYGKVINNS